MTESVEKSNEEMASAFIVGTCQLLPRSAHVSSDHRPMHNLMASNSHPSTEYSALCGSFAEFYIRPLIRCIDDIDVLVAQAGELVYSGAFPVLPSDFSGLADTIKFLKIEPYDRYPGFVRLRICGEMNYNWKFKKYEFYYTADTDRYVKIDMDIIRTAVPLESSTVPNIVCGPAIKQRSAKETEFVLEIDFVKSLWCAEWPKEAQGWLYRPRSNGWPTIDTITYVAQNGCHLVYVQHRSCRDDKKQWRFSFSLAEVILLQSWTQIQQIVYHLLRFFVKRKLIQNDCPKEDEILCPYHLKTLMLWTCEEMSPEWWESSSVISICSQLLKLLADWLKKRYCPNYFIPEANLFHTPSNPKVLAESERQLNKFCNSGILCNWFVENYILSFIRSNFKHVETRPHFMYYMQALLEYWKVSELESLDSYLHTTFRFSHYNSRSIMKHMSDPGLCQYLNTGFNFKLHDFKANWRLRDLPTVQNYLCFVYYANLLSILHTAYGLRCGEIAWNSNVFVEIVIAISMRHRIIRSQYHNFPKAYTAQNYCQYEFLRVQDLLRNMTGSTSPNEFRLLSLISKEFLTKALKRDGAISSGIIPAAMAYLSALHFAASEYQEATRLCSAVLMDQTYQEYKETLNAGCLLFIDDVTKIVGLTVLQRKFTEYNLSYTDGLLYLDLRLSPDVFAEYLLVLSAEKMSKKSDYYHELPDSSFPMDVNLTSFIKPMKSRYRYNAARQIVFRRPDSLRETQASNVNPTIVKERVLDALMEYAVENLTSFYTAIRKDVGVNCNTADCYRALSLYRCRKYDQVLHLCERILNECELQSDLKEFSFANVFLLPPLDSFFDSDVQSLLGFHTLFYYSSPVNDDMAKVETSVESTFEHWFARYVYRDGSGLVVFFQNPYSIKRHYFLGRRFLTRYLKLRCCIDRNLPQLEALTEFVAQKTTFPFERIIRRFLLRKLHNLK